MTLRSIPGGGTGPKSWRRRKLSEAEQVTCWKCEADTGVATSAVIKIVQSPMRAPGGRKTGGVEGWACAHCLGRGIVTMLLPA